MTLDFLSSLLKSSYIWRLLYKYLKFMQTCPVRTIESLLYNSRCMFIAHDLIKETFSQRGDQCNVEKIQPVNNISETNKILDVAYHSF